MSTQVLRLGSVFAPAEDTSTFRSTKLVSNNTQDSVESEVVFATTEGGGTPTNGAAPKLSGSKEKGLSTPVKIGIGIGVGVGAILLIRAML